MSKRGHTVTTVVELDLHSSGRRGATVCYESYVYKDAEGQRHNACYGLPLTPLGFSSRKGMRFRVTVEQL